RLPVHLVDKIARMRRTAAELEEELGRVPTDDELAYTLGISVNKVAHLKSVSVRPTSLDAPVGEDDSTEFGDLIGDENAVSPFENLKNKNILHDLQDMIEQLDPREAEIIRLRFGLAGEKPLTLEEVGERFKITRERVRQLQNIALTRMRRILSDLERQRNSEEIEEERIAKGRMEVLQEFYESNIETKVRH
ncbi:MAG: sigma-70 family RNA polymerase sigma factor, partial [Verrucomicrobia bacterium]|nr:sigma-70 family RNA polymerase sigma factor [Verrucomicrobiota bacterium]